MKNHNYDTLLKARRRPKQKSMEELHEEINAFNSRYKVGDVVRLKMDDHVTREVKIKHEATILGGHTAVGWFEGVSGCYNLSKVVKNG